MKNYFHLYKLQLDTNILSGTGTEGKYEDSQ